MLIEAARRVEASAKEVLALVNAGSASCAELREMLAVTKSAAAIVSAAQTSAAALIAGQERHGDGGAEVLADAAGLSRCEARSQVNTARVIEAAPAVRDAVDDGRVSQANAKRLAGAIEKTSAADVGADRELLAKAESLRPDRFAREVRRWEVERQGDDGAGEHARQRARRSVRVWDRDDGMVQLHGEFDAVTGKRIENRLRAEARRQYDSDKKHAAGSGGDRRTFQQCMADALDRLTADGTSGNSKPFADICVVAHLDEAASKLVAETPDGQRLPAAVLEELACSAKFTGVLYDRDGTPIWRAHSVRSATETQRQILFARYGGCFHCAAHPALCQIHHIKPVSQGGETKISNMVPACWDCHNLIHHHGWQMCKRPDGNHTLHPPDRVTYGPACAPEQPILHRLGDAAAPQQPILFESGSREPHEPTPSQHADASPQPTVGPLVRAGPAAVRAALRNARWASTPDPGSGPAP